jgi:hypothetical protein
MSARVPPEFTPTPDRLRHLAQRYGGKLPREVHQALLDAANEIEGSEEAFGTVVDDKRALQQEVAPTGSLLRWTYKMMADARSLRAASL